MENNFQCDIVVLYVTEHDENWVNLYNQYKKESLDEVEYLRYRETNILKYVLRSIDKNIPWINKVFLVVQSDSQVPEWVNREEVNVVLHEEFIPKEYLPTFNCNTIQMFLQNIPNLSNYFIKCSDDMFFNKKIYPEDFFVNGLPNIKIYESDFNSNTNILYFHNNMNNTIILRDYFNISSNNSMMSVGHYPQPFFKPLMFECYKTFENIINNSITRFREKKNLNFIFYSLYTYLKGFTSNKKINGCNISLKYFFKYYKFFANKYKIICVNDDIKQGDYLIPYTEMMKIMNNIFQTKSKYEKD